MTAHHKEIKIDSPDGQLSAYLAIPAEPTNVGIVVLQEIFGVNANIRAICDSFAASGYAAIAPDLYWRQQPGVQLDPSTDAGRAIAIELMKGLNREESLVDAIAAVEGLKRYVPDLDRFAAIGYCFGGGVAYLLGARGMVDTGIAYYGTGLQTMLDELDDDTTQLLLHIAGDDHLCPPDAQAAIQEAAAHSKRVDVVVHSGVGHAFARVGGSAFNAEAADRANGQTFDLLASMVSA